MNSLIQIRDSIAAVRDEINRLEQAPTSRADAAEKLGRAIDAVTRVERLERVRVSALSADHSAFDTAHTLRDDGVLLSVLLAAVGREAVVDAVLGPDPEDEALSMADRESKLAELRDDLRVLEAREEIAARNVDTYEPRRADVHSPLLLIATDAELAEIVAAEEAA